MPIRLFGLNLTYFCQSLWQQDSYETAVTDRAQQRQDSYETAPEDSLYDEDIHGQDEYYDEDYEGHWDRRGYSGHVSMGTNPSVESHLLE